MDIKRYLQQLVTLQLLSKVINLSLNIATARIVDKDIFSYANV